MAFVRVVETPFFTIVTVYLCRKLKPAEPGPSSEVIAGGIIGVPGAIGAGESAGATIPFSAPAKPWKRPGARISV